MGRPFEDQTRPLSVVLPQIDGACEGLAGGWNARSCAESLELSLCAAGWEAHALCEAQTRAVLGCTKKEIVRRPAHRIHAGKAEVACLHCFWGFNWGKEVCVGRNTSGNPPHGQLRGFISVATSEGGCRKASLSRGSKSFLIQLRAHLMIKMVTKR